MVLMGPARPQELWQLVCEHQAQVLVSLCPPDPQDEVRKPQMGGRASVLRPARLGREPGELPEQP